MISHTLCFNFETKDGTQQKDVAISSCVIAGWTGRDRDALEKHIVELEELGVKRPASTPIFYRVSASRLTTADTIEVLGGASGGEVEYTILSHGGKLWVGTGSDHTDREAERITVTLSKQICDKPVSSQLWAYDEVVDHWDQLILRSFVVENGERKLYQETTTASMLAPSDLIARYTDGKELSENTILFGGTGAAIGGVRATDDFEYEIEDPVLGRKITSRYKTLSLPVLG